ncbi:NTP-binding protein [Mesorhizobium sp. M4A.F.Ca.ET.050.02.1.1]|uniref:DNA primase family protein n=1 Tax=Mesorhizobium sp. M4A.F.Ca.ET.050.02.1.1 TaxID=2496754 RepID=UPI000FCBF4C2|nr:phage/plasmid primase, P4 family [Mesorhizobium sp. M4A.F.Ca.ET.050.02.1.1]RUX45425.1 NTP-binding protein [Mesorhizobium sp. M4A.F.Ca.ET.050.02.1.1]
MTAPKQISSPNQPMQAAEEFMTTKTHTDGWPTLCRWRGGWWSWDGVTWAEKDAEAVRNELYRYAKDKVYMVGDEAKPWSPDKRKIANLMEALTSVCDLPAEIEQPSWLDKDRKTGTIVPCRNGLLDMSSGYLLDPTPAYFNTVATPFDFDGDAPEPRLWFDFLDSLWPDKPMSKEALQQWFGYVVSGRTDLQKMLLMVGAKRGGKGTILRVMSAMVGGSVYGAAAADLVGTFGLQSAVGKSLMTLVDARFDSRSGTAVVERLLKISGEDEMAINRKGRGFWHGRLQTRIVVASNETLELEDASGAIVDRFIPLRLKRSWSGREDLTLGARLEKELPGIFNWALDGLDQLTERGRFTVPEDAEEVHRIMSAMSSAVGLFVCEMCHVGIDDLTVKTIDLYDAYVRWTHRHNVKTLSHAVFGKKLYAACPDVKRHQPRDPETDKVVEKYAGITLRDTPSNTGTRSPVPMSGQRESERERVLPLPTRADHAEPRAQDDR